MTVKRKTTHVFELTSDDVRVALTEYVINQNKNFNLGDASPAVQFAVDETQQAAWFDVEATVTFAYSDRAGE